MSEMEEFDGDDVMVAIRFIAKKVALIRGEIVDEIRLSGGSKVPSSAAERKILLVAAVKATASAAGRTALATVRKVDAVDIDIAIQMIANDPGIIEKAIAAATQIEFQSQETPHV
ncbi:hypothetical protein [Bradyrhizobium sp. BWA-3-5]|uniref:hypothetical protein n=1 Tax=Bradyrhizobium sp. BWA-3-5 TaxID=3080013 RepID=UPI00293F2FCD|nr:hypothetical protein [Bradyrhizobium sp. BWA-3-5]WOH68661.1 hypothetical protein RX331_13535 [Bradyrhizobium sp. BWA-3-5]